MLGPWPQSLYRILYWKRLSDSQSKNTAEANQDAAQVRLAISVHLRFLSLSCLSQFPPRSGDEIGISGSQIYNFVFEQVAEDHVQGQAQQGQAVPVPDAGGQAEPRATGAQPAPGEGEAQDAPPSIANEAGMVDLTALLAASTGRVNEEHFSSGEEPSDDFVKALEKALNGDDHDSGEANHEGEGAPKEDPKSAIRGPELKQKVLATILEGLIDPAKVRSATCIPQRLLHLNPGLAHPNLI